MTTPVEYLEYICFCAVYERAQSMFKGNQQYSVNKNYLL